MAYPDGFAVMNDLKRDMAILATSGYEWAERTKRLAARMQDLNIFSQGLVERKHGGWRITDKGRNLIDKIEGLAAPDQPIDLDAGKMVAKLVRSPRHSAHRR